MLSGPHFFVGQPTSTRHRAEGVQAQQSTTTYLDLTTLPDGYLPRTNYVPACDPSVYETAPNAMRVSLDGVRVKRNRAEGQPRTTA